jgi:4-carboxymuconolactone decarboxylase
MCRGPQSEFQETHEEFMAKDSYKDGEVARRKMLGDKWVDRSLANRNDFNADFIDQITRHVWCDIWTRPGLDQRTRRFMAITVMMALNRWEEFRLHVMGGLNAGDITKNDLKEIILQATVYCGAPVGNRAMKEATVALKEVGK